MRFNIFHHPAFRLLFQGYIDCHCHILPGVDDGVRTMDESLRILELYESLGVKSVWLTPHIMEDMPNTTENLLRRYRELLDSYKGNIIISLSSENMLDNLFIERLAADDLLPLGRRRQHLLVETSYFNPPIDLLSILDKIKARGYYPVLAHPERYVYMDNAYYKLLKQRGVLFQLNLFSLAGSYGKEACQKANYLLRNGMYDITGTDTHSHVFISHAVDWQCKNIDVLQTIDNGIVL